MLYYALVFLVVGLIANTLNLAGVSTVAAAECRVTDLIDGGTIQGMPTGKGTILSILPLTITAERDFYGGLVPSPVLDVAPYVESSRIVLGKTEDRGMATIGACWSQDLRKSALYNHAMFRSIVKRPAKAHTQFMKIPVLLYNGNRQGLTIRTTPPEIGISSRLKADPLIGPVQEIRKSVLSDNRTVSQAVATLPSTVESLSLFGGQPSVASNPFQRALQRPNNDSLRMNLTTGQVLQGGNCASGCP
ncbi:MAG TPA: hypothetical protein VGQ79_06820 [Nitrospiraceae bacterium]|jgi:hypothetical protein|nr:hypothetical protein [Nitrospiraceae bacterium]